MKKAYASPCNEVTDLNIFGNTNATDDYVTELNLSLNED